MISADGVTKDFSGRRALQSITYRFEKAHRYAIVGPSGCGKSTLLNLLSGLDGPTDGAITRAPQCKLAYVFQDHPLLPWRTAYQNLTLGFEVQNRPIPADLIADYLNQFKLIGIDSKLPSELSGGMKQRVALIQSLALSPNILLLDEPFSALDFDVKLIIQRRLLAEQQTTEKCLILVTHDIEDAISMAHEVIILSPSQPPKRVKVPEPVANADDPLSARLRVRP